MQCRGLRQCGQHWRRTVELRRGDDFLEQAVGRPVKLARRVAGALVVFHDKIVLHSGGERDAGAAPLGALIQPFIKEQHAVHPQAHAVVAARVKLVVLREPRLHLPSPARAECVRLHRRAWRACAPREVDSRIQPCAAQRGEVRVVIVSAAQSVAAAGGALRGGDDELRFVGNERRRALRDGAGVKAAAGELHVAQGERARCRAGHIHIIPPPLITERRSRRAHRELRGLSGIHCHCRGMARDAERRGINPEVVGEGIVVSLRCALPLVGVVHDVELGLIGNEHRLRERRGRVGGEHREVVRLHAAVGAVPGGDHPVLHARRPVHIRCGRAGVVESLRAVRGGVAERVAVNAEKHIRPESIRDVHALRQAHGGVARARHLHRRARGLQSCFETKGHIKHEVLLVRIRPAFDAHRAGVRAAVAGINDEAPPAELRVRRDREEQQEAERVLHGLVSLSTRIFPVSSVRHTMARPSGDQSGSDSRMSGVCVSCCRPRPSAPMIHSSESTMRWFVLSWCACGAVSGVCCR